MLQVIRSKKREIERANEAIASRSKPSVPYRRSISPTQQSTIYTRNHRLIDTNIHAHAKIANKDKSLCYQLSLTTIFAILAQVTKVTHYSELATKLSNTIIYQ
jgi:hypothetical protein